MEIGEYAARLTNATNATICTDDAGVQVLRPVAALVEFLKHSKKVVFIGNGGSLAACAHMANDLSLAGVPALDLGSAVNMACIGNDFGFAETFARQVEWFLCEGDTLIAMSCSGNSENILKAVAAARKISAAIITFSGFNGENPLRSRGDANYWVPSSNYGFVQLAHETLLHCAIDTIAGII